MAKRNSSKHPYKNKYNGLSLQYPKEYQSWVGIKDRCLNPNHKSWHNYGGRGIKICKRWRHSFKNFLDDMGPKPSARHTIDRYPDKNGHYEPNNCRWATHKEQARNRRDNVLLTFKGQTKCLQEWSEELGIGLGTLCHRLYVLKQPVSQALGIDPREYFTNRGKKHTHQGETKTIAQWCRDEGISMQAVMRRLEMGWTMDQALFKAAKSHRRRMRDVRINGKKRSVLSLAKEYGINYYTLLQRLDKGWDVQRALQTPVNTKNQKKRPPRNTD